MGKLAKLDRMMELCESHGHLYILKNDNLIFMDIKSDWSVEKIDITNMSINEFLIFLGY